MRSFATSLACAAIVAAVLTAPSAMAAPECVDTAPNTTLCSTNGSSSLVTSPSAPTGPNYGGFSYGGFGFGFGGLFLGF